MAQIPEKKINGDPLFFIDGKEMLKSEMANVNPNDIAMVTVLKEDAYKKYGEKGKNGIILIETKVYSRKRFQRYLSTKSAKYKMLLGDNSDDQNIQYILNEKVLNKDYEGDLASIADSTFIDINIVSAEELKAYKVTDKRYGVLIKTKVKAEPVRQEVKQSKFEPELLILSVGGISFDPTAIKSIEEKNKKLKQEISNPEQMDLSKVKEENSRLMMQSAIAYAEKLNFFNQISMLSQNYLTYRFIERFPNTLVLLKDITAENGLTDLAKIARDENIPYVLSFPSAHIAKEKGHFVLQLKVQLYEAESNSLVLDKEYKGDQTNPGFEFSCDGSIQCTINNALSGALADVIHQIALNNKTLKAEQILARKRFDFIKSEIFPKNNDLSLIKSVVNQSDSTVNFSDLYQTFYSDDKSKFIGFFFRKVDKQGLKGLSESKKDHNVKILSGASIKDKNFLDVPQNYAYIVKGVSSKGKWYYKKDMVTYFEAENENEGKLAYLNKLQDWGYFNDNLIAIDPGFWEGKLFKKIEDKRKHPDWEEYNEMWESEERENRNYIGMYKLVADRLKEEKQAAEDDFKDSIANHVFKPFYDAAIKSKKYKISGYESVLKDFLLIYNADKNVVINPLEIKDDTGMITVRYFVFLRTSGNVYEWNYFPAFTKKKGSAENGIMENLETITKWNYSYDTLDDEQFWSKYVLFKENGVYKYLK
ncbi:hypothetical protein [Pedobacter gandavensis]|uniref:Uncharacterized protein n=1 Tax=Pedobacter gandavensis TaxID=2679963 RepID=A0ABR6ETT1_9SPHI|nr:hypothetical protein [Pedobacter gandavensis]MBB2148671.1 hypothetical protein [Pedobacter gandavensis]